jgi:N-acetylglutamate synthase-like GNAT family acetyltransferase
MLTIKSVHGLLEEEKEQIQEMLNTFYTSHENNIFVNSIIVFDKSSNGEIKGCIAANTDKHTDYSIINHICVKREYQNKGIGKRMVSVLQSVSKSRLLMCLSKKSPLIQYLKKLNFTKKRNIEYINCNSNQIIMIL